MNSRQIGRFRISAFIIQLDPQKVADLFRLMNAVPVRAEMHFDRQEIEYTAISKLFSEVEEGGETPEYVLNITEDEVQVERR